MERSHFLQLVKKQTTAISLIAQEAARVHENVNQTYDKTLPYAFHLRMAASYVTRFGHLILKTEDHLDTLYAAIYFHDALEDARLSYNDLKKIFERLNTLGCNIQTEIAVEAVYALTNDKGRTRSERAGENYYQGIRATPYAPFLKMCDRLANIRYATLFAEENRMATIYREEMKHFLTSIGNVPQEMKKEAECYFAEFER